VASNLQTSNIDVMSLSKVVSLVLEGSAHGPPVDGSCVLYIHRNYGYVITTMVGSVLLCVWKAVKVNEARKQYKIFYPTVYSTENDDFNCIQRAHHATLEYMPAFLGLLLIGGLEMPVLCAVAGNVWVASRIVYARGCYSGDPKRRAEGAFGTIGLFALLGSTMKFALKLIMSR